jgi:transcriptional regulator GlxA family with amidase domain
VVETIDDDLAADFSLSGLARLADISIPHFCRAFKRSAGCPPYTFVIQRRIAHAKELLRHTDKPVTEIALDCGFSSSCHFANVFRRKIGVTAGQHRRTSTKIRGCALDRLNIKHGESGRESPHLQERQHGIA